MSPREAKWLFRAGLALSVAFGLFASLYMMSQPWPAATLGRRVVLVIVVTAISVGSYLANVPIWRWLYRRSNEPPDQRWKG